MEMPRDLKFNVMDGDQVAIRVEYDAETDRMRAEILDPRVTWMLPEEGDWEDVLFFLNTRVFPRRPNEKIDLDLLGLKKRDLFAILKITHGYMTNDRWTIDPLYGF